MAAGFTSLEGVVEQEARVDGELSGGMRSGDLSGNGREADRNRTVENWQRPRSSSVLV